MHSISVFILKSISGGVCSTWNTKLKSSPLQKLCLWGRWQLLLTKYPKVSVEVRIISCILFWSQEKLASNQRSSLQKRKIRNSQIQAEAAPLFLVWLHFSIFTVKWHKVPSSGKRIYLSQSGVSRMLRGGSAAVERAPECVLAVRHCLESQESLENSRLFWILPCLPDLRKGSHCRKTSSNGWSKQEHLIKESKWKLLQVPCFS